jgi:hypothetical protein
MMRGQTALDETGAPADLAPDLQRQLIDYPTTAAPGAVVIDTKRTYLYYVLGNSKAIRYGIGVGRDGFTWSGAQTVTRKTEWPDCTPTQEMIGGRPIAADDLFPPDISRLDDWPPFLDIGLHKLPQGLWCTLLKRKNQLALIGEAFDHGRIGQGIC